MIDTQTIFALAQTLISELPQYANASHVESLVDSEGLFDVELGADSRNYLDGLLQRATDAVRNEAITHRHGVDSKVIDAIIDLACVLGTVYFYSEDNRTMLLICGGLCVLRFTRHAAKVREMLNNFLGIRPEGLPTSVCAISGALFLFKFIGSLGFCASFDDVLHFFPR